LKEGYDMANNILVATDGSEFSSGAEREAIKYAKRSGGRLIALSVIEFNPELLALAPQLVEKSENEAREHLDALKNTASKENVPCEAVLREDEEPYKVILKEADKSDSDLIITGRRGRTGLMRILMGSVTARVIGHYQGKVLIVPRKASVDLKNILVATDGSEYGNAAVNEALNYAKTYGASLKVVHVINIMADFQGEIPARTPSLIDEVTAQVKSDLDAIKERAEKEGVKTGTYIKEGDPYKLIVDLAKELNSDLIVLGSHGRTGIQRLLMGSVAERVIGHADCAVLVVKK
jgi:nucleotide-binding universal stress UspA family protein